MNINKNVLNNIKFVFGLFFIIIAIISVIFSVYFEKNYIFDIIQKGTIGILLVFYSDKVKKPLNSVAATFLFILFIAASIMKYC